MMRLRGTQMKSCGWSCRSVLVFTGSLGTDQIVLRIGSARRDEAFEKEIKDTFRSKVRVAPEVIFEPVEYIAKKQMPQMSRKQIKFVDLREQTK